MFTSSVHTLMLSLYMITFSVHMLTFSVHILTFSVHILTFLVHMSTFLVHMLTSSVQNVNVLSANVNVSSAHNKHNCLPQWTAKRVTEPTWPRSCAKSVPRELTRTRNTRQVVSLAKLGNTPEPTRPPQRVIVNVSRQPLHCEAYIF